MSTRTNSPPRALRLAGVSAVALALFGCPSNPPPPDGGSDVVTPPRDGNDPPPVDGAADVTNPPPVDGGTDVVTPPPDGSVRTPSASMVVACGTTCERPLDAVPTANGQTIYFTAFLPDGVAAVFRVPAAGGAIETVTSGNGLEYPVGIAISMDDGTLFIADQAADRNGLDGVGAVFRVPSGGGMPSMLDVGMELTRPASVTVSQSGTSLFIAGRRASDEAPSVFEVPVTGGTAVVRASDLADPSGISQAPDGRVIVHDTIRGGEHSATAVLVMGMGTTPYAGGLVAGYPAGLSFSMDGTGALFSGSVGRQGGLLTWSPAPGMAMNPESLSAGMVQPLGLHRARGAEVYSVADEGAMDNGAIFLVR